MMKNDYTKGQFKGGRVGSGGASAGETGLRSGLSDYSKATNSNSELGMDHGEGQRPSAMKTGSLSHGGRKFKNKG